MELLHYSRFDFGLIDWQDKVEKIRLPLEYLIQQLGEEAFN